MKKTILSKILLVAMSSVLVLSCAPKNDVSVCIPSDAMMVAKVDVKSLYDKSLGDGSAESQVILDRIRLLVQEEEMSIAQKGMLVKAVENPLSAFGMNFNIPAYMSVVMDMNLEEFEIYLSLGVSDRNTVKLILQEAFGNLSDFRSSVLENGEDYYYMSDMALALSDEMLVVYIDDIMDFEYSAFALEKLLSQKHSDMNPKLEGFLKADNDVNLWMDCDDAYTEMMPIIREEDRTTYMFLKQLQTLYDGMVCNMSLDFNDGSTVVEASVQGSDELMDMMDKYQQPANDSYYDLIPPKSFLAGNFAISETLFTDIWEYFVADESLSSYIQLLESQFGIDKEFIKGLPGVITFGISVDENEEIYASAAIECEDDVYEETMELIESLTEFVGYDNDGYYKLYTKTYDWELFDVSKKSVGYVRYVDGAAVVMTPEFWEMTDAGTDFSGAASSSTMDEIAGGGLVLDLECFPEGTLASVADELSDELGFYVSPEEVLGIISSVVCTYGDNNLTLSCNMQDQDHNILQKYISLFSRTIL